MSYLSEKPVIDADSVVWFSSEQVKATTASPSETAVGVSIGPMATRFVSEARSASVLIGEVPAPHNASSVGAVIGNVISAEEDTVLCELRADGRLIEVGLPRALFPENVKWGASVSIRMQVVNGFRTPIVEVREAQRNEDPRIEEMEQLIAELPG